MVFGIGRALKGKRGQPGFVEPAFEELTRRSLEASRDPSLFQAAPNVALGTALGAASGIPKFQFDFGKRASRDFGRASNILGQAAGRVGDQDRFIAQAGRDISRFRDPVTGEEIQTGISQFLNPFIQQTIDPALADLREQASIQRGDVGTQFTQSGAFGSSRQGLAEGLIGQGAIREAGRLSGQLRSQGFESAADRALQNILEGRQRFGTAAGLGLDQARQTLAGAQQLGSLGGRLGQLGQQQIGAREAVERLRAAPTIRAGQQLALGQAAQESELAQRQAPLRSLDFLTRNLQSIPAGIGRPTPGTKGKLGSILGGAVGGLLGGPSGAIAGSRILG